MSTVVFGEAFVEELMEDPEAFLISMGIEPSEAMVAQISRLDKEALLALARAFKPLERSAPRVDMIFP